MADVSVDGENAHWQADRPLEWQRELLSSESDARKYNTCPISEK